jgi:hypothetical protein
MSLVFTPFLSSPWHPVSPGELDLSTRLDRLDENFRALGHGPAALADRWAESLGEAPAAVELLSPSSGDPARDLANQWEKENR